MTCEISQTRTIHVTIVTFEGLHDRFRFKSDTLVKDVKAETLERFNIEPAPGGVYKLAKSEDGQYKVLNDNNSLVTEGVRNKDKIWLGTEQEVG